MLFVIEKVISLFGVFVEFEFDLDLLVGFE